MNQKIQKIGVAILVYGVVTAISVAVFHGQGLGLVIDGILLFGLFYYLSTLTREHSS